jgi:hypothetical protein
MCLAAFSLAVAAVCSRRRKQMMEEGLEQIHQEARGAVQQEQSNNLEEPLLLQQHEDGGGDYQEDFNAPERNAGEAETAATILSQQLLLPAFWWTTSARSKSSFTLRDAHEEHCHDYAQFLLSALHIAAFLSLGCAVCLLVPMFSSLDTSFECQYVYTASLVFKSGLIESTGPTTVVTTLCVCMAVATVVSLRWGWSVRHKEQEEAAAAMVFGHIPIDQSDDKEAEDCPRRLTERRR